MAEQSNPNNNYAQGHSNYTVATHLTRTAESDAAFLLPHIKKTDHILDVIGHMMPPDVARRALAEMRRVLKPGGLLATRDGADQHFYPRSSDLDRLWVGNSARVLRKRVPDDVDSPGTSMPALLHSVGFDVGGGKVRTGAGTVVFSGLETRKWLAWRAAAAEARRRLPPELAGCRHHPDEIQETLVAVQKWAETEDAWFAALQCETLAWK
ncbi:uncharacterized protein Z519_02759 [Cladophialophora bantiana CBS 173.52]|uniref:Methyltransferase type 11 domain-containing protein n=1 Tax=Cladophialophora bantiana (strain ATCC 10958 / CBS 173.52 / CDC B-1940 / NIH 8579) TaxID=1442370 RepID=A0A0D2GG74_CLAB1|nr:uncharacterized protein Z519_02759 [Cladophialophora bantiana CBS 173.52]KIW97367.1 hypothetical protein Z519_02759 [Cladophialophora bantiana CBS 173.52]